MIRKKDKRTIENRKELGFRSFGKLIAVTLSIAMLFSLLAGCGNAEDSDGNTDGTADVSGNSTESDQTGEVSAEELLEQISATESDMDVDKAETVYVTADAGGDAREVKVEATLKHNTEGDPIEDVAHLTDIKNTSGNETYTKGKNDALTWTNLGEDITYEGISDAELPVTEEITFTLDGKKVSPEELAGSSGDLTIRFDYTNHTEVPFMVITAFILDEDVFSHVEVENGSLMDMEGTSAVIGYAMPGLEKSLELSDSELTEDIDVPEYVEIKAEVKDFELSFTATIISTGLFGDLEDDDLEDADDLSDDMDELQDATDDLADAAQTLSDGTSEFSDSINTYIDGVSALNTGIGQLAGGAAQLKGAGTKLADGANALLSGIQSMQEVVKQMPSSETIAEAAKTAASADAAADVTEKFDELIEAAETEEAKETLLAAKEAVVGNLSIDLSSELFAGIDAAEAGLSQGLSSLATGISGDGTEANPGLAGGIKTYAAGVDQVVEGINSIASGASELNSYGPAIKSGAGELSSGTDEFASGMKKYSDEGISELTDLVNDDILSLIDRLKTTRDAENSYTNFSGLSEGKTGSVQFVIETESIEKS